MKNVLLLLCAFLGLSGCHAAQDGDTIDNSTVSVFDVRRFMGKWYEIARYDHRFEKGMTLSLLPILYRKMEALK